MTNLKCIILTYINVNPWIFIIINSIYLFISLQPPISLPSIYAPIQANTILSCSIISYSILFYSILSRRIDLFLIYTNQSQHILYYLNLSYFCLFFQSYPGVFYHVKYYHTSPCSILSKPPHILV